MRFSPTPPPFKMLSHVINGYYLSPLLGRSWIITTCNDFSVAPGILWDIEPLILGSISGEVMEMCSWHWRGLQNWCLMCPEWIKRVGFFYRFRSPLGYWGNYQEKELYPCCPFNLRVFYLFPRTQLLRIVFQIWQCSSLPSLWLTLFSYKVSICFVTHINKHLSICKDLYSYLFFNFSSKSYYLNVITTMGNRFQFCSLLWIFYGEKITLY